MRLLQKPKFTHAAGVRRKVGFTARVETLELRSLLSTLSATFQPPPQVAVLIQAVEQGKNIDSDGFNDMVTSLQTQIKAKLFPKNAKGFPDPSKDAKDEVETADELIEGFENTSLVDFAKLAPTLNTLLQDQGDSLKSNLKAELLGSSDGLSTIGLVSPAGTDFLKSSYLSVQELTLSRKLWPVDTPMEEFLIRSLQAKAGLQTVTSSFTWEKLKDDQAARNRAAKIVDAEASAYKYDMLLATTQNPAISTPVDQAVNGLIDTVNTRKTSKQFSNDLNNAVALFDATLVGPQGLFGCGGPFGQVITQPQVTAKPLPIDIAANFTNLQYVEVDQPYARDLNRYSYTNESPYDRGSFLTPDSFNSPAEAIRQLALDQSWFPETNSAKYVLPVKLAANIVYYEGSVAPIYQGIYQRESTPSLYPGGAEQVYVDSRADGITWGVAKLTDTGK